MHLYTTGQWVLLFFFYCFCGWVWECCYVSLRQRRWVNRGFLHGPVLPIYGSGAIIILFVTLPVQQDLRLVFLLGTAAATALEYITGAVMEREDLEAVAEVLRDTNVMVLSDEIYAELNYGLRPHVSIASLPGMAERTIVVNGFSKSYAMTGWRLGYACGPEPIIKIMTKIHQSAIMSAPTTSQYAAITALRDCDGEIDRMRDEYNMRRRLVVRGFNDMGLTCFEPRGAFYAFPCIRSTSMSSQEFCTKLLEQKHVAIIPGDAFGASGEGYCRVSYAYSVEHLTEALKRIREFLQENGLVQGN